MIIINIDDQGHTYLLQKFIFLLHPKSFCNQSAACFIDADTPANIFYLFTHLSAKYPIMFASTYVQL